MRPWTANSTGKAFFPKGKGVRFESQPLGEGNKQPTLVLAHRDYRLRPKTSWSQKKNSCDKKIHGMKNSTLVLIF